MQIATPEGIKDGFTPPKPFEVEIVKEITRQIRLGNCQKKFSKDNRQRVVDIRVKVRSSISNELGIDGPSPRLPTSAGIRAKEMLTSIGWDEVSIKNVTYSTDTDPIVFILEVRLICKREFTLEWLEDKAW